MAFVQTQERNFVLSFRLIFRSCRWLLHACLRATSKLRFITSFMLAHPRRIFYYIFPPYETRALFLVVMLLTAIDWGCFFVSRVGSLDMSIPVLIRLSFYQLLDVGFTSPVFSISTGTAVLSGLVQSVAVRSAGFYTVVSESCRVATFEAILAGLTCVCASPSIKSRQLWICFTFL